MLNSYSISNIRFIYDQMTTSLKKPSIIPPYQPIVFGESSMLSSSYVSFNSRSFRIITPSIRNHIISLNKIGRLYTFTLGKRNIKLHIILHLKSKNKTQKYKRNNRQRSRQISQQRSRSNSRSTEFKKIFQKTYSILGFLTNEINPSCSADLSIYLYLTDLKKTLPTEVSEEITEENVNTGFTFGCSLDNEIYIYRREEWDKVLIHELIHAFGLDFASNTELNTEANRRLLDFFKITGSKDLRIYEAYTETWATILCGFFNSHSLISFERNIAIQQKWAINQYLKIIGHYDLNGDMFECEKSIILKEKVTIFSYYLLKCRLLFSIDRFFDFCASKKYPMSMSIPGIINFEKTYRNIDAFMEMITKEIYGTDTTKFFELVDTISQNGKMENMRTSLRMTAARTV